MAKELSKDPNISQSPLSVCVTHDAVQEVDLAELATVVITVLTSRDGMQVEFDADTVFATPGNHTEDVFPADFLEEWLAIPRFDCPEWDGETDPVETCASNLSEVDFGLEKYQSRRSESDRRKKEK